MDHDKICLDCEVRGRCCYYKVKVNGFILETNEKCRFLLDNGLCSVYEKRHEMKPSCLKIDQIRELGLFPPDCNYIKDDPEYLSRKDRVIPREVIEKAANEFIRKTSKNDVKKFKNRKELMKAIRGCNYYDTLSGGERAVFDAIEQLDYYMQKAFNFYCLPEIHRFVDSFLRKPR